jgi:hypothetical protein
MVREGTQRDESNPAQGGGMPRCIVVVSVVGLIGFTACGRDAKAPQAPTPLAEARATPAPTPGPTPATPVARPGGDSLSGWYTLTVNLGSGCAVVPEPERTRNYTARIDYSEGGRYIVTLSDATFLSGLICTAGGGRFAGIGCNQFFATEDNGTAAFVLENNNDDAHGGHIVEQLSSGGWAEIFGNAAGQIRPSSIEASGTGSAWYCRTPASYPFPCASFAGCSSADLRLTLVRK